MNGFAEGVPTVEIQLAGKPYTLGWTLGSMRRLRERLAAQGLDLKDAIAQAENLPAVVWASMDKETREAVSVDDIEEMLHTGNQDEVIEKISSLFKRPEPEPATESVP